MTQQRYAIDACALINASKAYNLKKKAFSHIWGKFDELFENGILVSNIEIFDELKDKDLQDWAKKHKESFLPLDEGTQKRTTEILAAYPTLVKIRPKGASSNGDPFLIATAIQNNCTVITDEKVGDEKTGDYKIPNVCKKYDIDCISLSQFLDSVLE
ncbi:DUF4411 family protein [Oscillibacter valericigenes]|nr:DUF4411 family protein [Oscillibacter valericigenes]